MTDNLNTDVDTLSPSDAALGDAYTDPNDSGSTVIDLDENGVDDTVVVELAPGVTGYIVDVDENGSPDTVLIDTNGDGQPDTQVTPDGAGNFVISYDDDQDGVTDRDQTVTRDELESMAPGLADVLDPGSDTTGDPADDGSTDYTVTDGQIIGDPSEASEHWFEQAANGFCAPACIAQIVSEYSGQDFTDESAFVELANQMGVWQVGPDGVPGLTIEGAAAVLEQSGVPAAIVTGGGITMLADYLASGHGVMVAIDSGEVWQGEATEDNLPDHMVVVAGIDAERGVVLLSDPGSPDGDLEEVPIDVFMDAWADSDNSMIVAEDPAPTTDDQAAAQDAADQAAASTTTPETGGSDQMSSSEDGDAEAAVSQIASVTATAVTQPWVLLPIALPAPSAPSA